jgi:hypothetical protein
MISRPNPCFHGQEVRDETTIRRPTHQGCLIHTKELEKHAPVREPSTPRTIVPRGRGSDDGLPREDRTTWFVAGSRQRAARRAAVSAHMALDVGVDCRRRGDLRPYWGAADPLGPPQSAAQVGPPQTHSRLSNRRYREAHPHSAVSKPQAQRFKVIGNGQIRFEGDQEDKLARESHRRGTIRRARTRYGTRAILRFGIPLFLIKFETPVPER